MTYCTFSCMWQPVNAVTDVPEEPVSTEAVPDLFNSGETVGEIDLGDGSIAGELGSCVFAGGYSPVPFSQYLFQGLNQ